MSNYPPPPPNQGPPNQGPPGPPQYGGPPGGYQGGPPQGPGGPQYPGPPGGGPPPGGFGAYPGGPPPGGGGGISGKAIAAIVAAVVLLAGGAVAAVLLLSGDDDDGGDAGDSPSNASVEEFCEEFTSLQEEDDSDLSTEEEVERAHEMADRLAEIGTPEDMPEDAREGFEIYIDAIKKVDEEKAEELENLDSDDEVADALGIAQEDQEKVEAFFTYTFEECFGTDSTPGGGAEAPTEELPTDLPTDELPTDFPTDFTLPTDFPTDFTFPTDFPTDFTFPTE